jgi:hypothetical protein
MATEKHHQEESEPTTCRSGVDSAGMNGPLSAFEQQALADWYLAFRRAAAREHALIAPAVAALNMDQTAVPVMIPLEVPGRQKGSTTELLSCLDLYHALLLDAFTRLTAADPDQPTTNEVALAQIQLAMSSFTTGSFAEMIREERP